MRLGKTAGQCFAAVYSVYWKIGPPSPRYVLTLGVKHRWRKNRGVRYSWLVRVGKNGWHEKTHKFTKKFRGNKNSQDCWAKKGTKQKARSADYCIKKVSVILAFPGGEGKPRDSRKAREAVSPNLERFRSPGAAATAAAEHIISYMYRLPPTTPAPFPHPPSPYK
jgi:hypothetical protein